MGRPAELASQFLSFLPEPVTSIALSILFGPPNASPADQLESSTISHIEKLSDYLEAGGQYLFLGGDPWQVLWRFLLSEIVHLPKTSPATQMVVDPVIAGLRLLCAGEVWSHEQVQEARILAHEMSLSWARRMVESQQGDTKVALAIEATMGVEAHVALAATDAASLVERHFAVLGGDALMGETLDGKELAQYLHFQSELVYSSVNQFCVCHARAAQAALAEDASSSDSILRSLKEMKRHRHLQLGRLFAALVNHSKGSIAFHPAGDHKNGLTENSSFPFYSHVTPIHFRY